MKQIFYQTLALCSMGLLCAGTMSAQTAYTYVNQNGTKVSAVGTAQFDVSNTLTVEFVNGKAVMKSGTNKVAELPMTDSGQLVVQFTNPDATDGENKLAKTVSSSGYATLYSPFQLEVPAEGDVEVYAPTYANGTLKLNSDTKVDAGSIIPAGTGLILKNAGDIVFTFSEAAATATQVSALDGSALVINKPDVSGKTVYTLGHESNTNEYGFFAYSGPTMAAGKAYLLATTVSEASIVRFSFEEEAGSETGIDNVEQPINTDGKRFENGRLVIYRDGKKYSSTGIILK